jgi:hypothetical protein
MQNIIYSKWLNKKYVPIVFILFILVFSCQKVEDEQPFEKILVRIGEKTISENEFLRRAEYTIRPKYCADNNYIHKKIVLNSLVAEKMMALEAGENNKLTQNEDFQLYLKGRKEQAMRQFLYYSDAYKKVELDSSELKKVYKVAGRTYDVSYFTVDSEDAANAIKTVIEDKDATFDEIFSELIGGEEVPRREIKWTQPEETVVHNSLFIEKVEKGQTIGPLKVDDESYLVIKVNGWKDELPITNNQIRRKMNEVKEVLLERKATKIYYNYISDLMRGKSVEFNEEIFRKLVNIVGPMYYKKEREKREAFNKKFWNKDDSEMILDDSINKLNEIMNDELLIIDGNSWTVGDYNKEIISHPLVFRKRKFPKNDFSEQFKFAIVDLIRDKYITQDAYKKNYDKANIVNQNYEMWKDNLLALYQKEEIIKTFNIKGRSELDIIVEKLNPYFNELQKKYNDIVEIDIELFEKINLTSIDMFVIQKNAPFPVIVPGFPQLTTDHSLDYGKKISD